jgi:3-oxoadipate enol-lactonase
MLYYRSNRSFNIHNPSTSVTFLHAFPLHSLMWDSQFEELKKHGIEYVAPDYPGFGQSELIGNSLSMEDYADSIFDFLKALEIGKSVFVCSSLGGYVAFALLRKHPELFKGLVLANTKASADSEVARQRRWSSIQDIEKTGDGSSLIENLLQKLITVETREQKPEIVNQLHSMMQDASLKGIIQAQQAMANRKDSIDLIKNISFPILMIAGAKDELIQVDEMHHMMKMTPSARLVIIPDAAHLSMMENPEQFNISLIDFLKQFFM